MTGFRVGAAVGAVALTFCALALGATPNAGRYKGSTSAHKALKFTVSAGGKKVTALKVSYDVTCPSGATLSVDADDILGSFTVKNGRFSGSGKLGGQGTGKVAGKFTSAKTASGTVRMQPVNDNTAGEEGQTNPPETCDSGTLKWTAKRG